MGHAVNPDREYRLLQRRLDREVTGAPDSPALMRILRLLFRNEDVPIARRMPSQLMPLDALAGRLGIPKDELDGRLTDMARRGLVFDLEHQGQRYFALAPVVIGFFEMTFMRTRDELPMGELARLFDEYMLDDDRFTRGVFRGKTQVGRSLVREESLPEDDHTEILDWERASHIVKTASAVSISLCACRHAKSHLGNACDAPLDLCMSFNYGAESLSRAGLARQVSTDEALQVLQRSREAGLAQTADNVQRKVTYICNCCGCCCGMMQAIRTHNLRGAIVTSNWIAQVDPQKCKGCGLCAKACPVEAIHVEADGDGQAEDKRAIRDEELCLGCGVCYSACKTGAISMRPRPKRVYTPETVFHRVVSMAIERGKLGEMIFDQRDRLTHRALGVIARIVEKSPFFKAAMAIKPLRSAFLERAVQAARKKLGPLTEMME